jgi:hypothetical protein
VRLPNFPFHFWGLLLVFYILCSESLVEVDRLIAEVEGRGVLTKYIRSRRSRSFDRVKSKSKRLIESRIGQPARGRKVGALQLNED